MGQCIDIFVTTLFFFLILCPIYAPLYSIVLFLAKMSEKFYITEVYRYAISFKLIKDNNNFVDIVKIIDGINNTI